MESTHDEQVGLTPYPITREFEMDTGLRFPEHCGFRCTLRPRQQPYDSLHMFSEEFSPLLNTHKPFSRCSTETEVVGNDLHERRKCTPGPPPTA